MATRQPIDFLGATTRSATAAITHSNRARLRLFRRTVRLASEVLFAAAIRRQDTKRVIAAALLGRLLTTTQSGVLLVRHGLEHDASALLRLAFETLAILRACCEREDFYRHYLNSDLGRQRKLAIAGQRLSGCTPTQKKRLHDTEQALAKEIAKRGATAITIEAVAQSVNLADMYNSLYRLASAAVHVAPRSLEEHARLKDGKFAELVFGPSAGYAELHIFSFTEFLIIGMGCFGNLCSVDRGQTWRRLYGDLKKQKPTMPVGWVSNTVPVGP